MHIKTSNAVVLDFFTNATSAYPSSLGSFTTLPDDNSVLSGFASDIVAEGPDIGQTKSGPNHWGFIFQYYSKTWGITAPP